jgi:amino-acid N-acetyltransferase
MGFLTANSLTTVGVEDWYRNFFIASDENGTWVGVAGYELYKQSALLRSVAVETASRRQGYGQVLVETVLADARKLGVHTVYLFTETAEPYFKRLGFEAVDRREIEQPVMQSAEVRERCSECQAMRRRI